MAPVIIVTHHDDYHMLPAMQSIVPAGKEAALGETGARTHLVGVGKRGGKQLKQVREQLRVLFGNVLFALLGKLAPAAEIWTLEAARLGQ